MTEQFTEADVQLVAAAINDASGYTYADDAEGWAPYVLRALAEAGRLVPDGTKREVEYAIKWVRDDTGNTWYSEPYYRRDLAETHREPPETVVQRTIYAGPWVEADEDSTR